jgi:TPR repeat protein
VVALALHGIGRWMIGIMTSGHWMAGRLTLRAVLAAWIMVVAVAGAAVAAPCVASDDRGQYSATEHVRCLRQEADQGDSISQYLLGAMYLLGQGVPQDYAEAVKWLHLAADHDIGGAQFVLGGMYAQGKGVPKDVVRAHKWFNLSGAQGFEDAGKFRDDLARDMTPAQIAEAQKLAREWKPK